MSSESYKSKKRQEIGKLDDRKLAEETLMELKVQNHLSRKEGSYLKKINTKVQVFFWIFLAYVIFATTMLLSGGLEALKG